MAAPQRDRSAEQPLVGRAEVLRQLATLRASAGSGGLGILVLEGEAGIGKTALAEKARRDATGEGWTTVWVQGVQADAALAYGGLLGLTTALRQHLAELPERQPDDVARLMRDLRKLFTPPGSSSGPLGRLGQIP
jgi:hypothetical protein